MAKHYKVVIIGAGSGGIPVAARLIRDVPVASIVVIDPAQKHYYQPAWTMAGASIVAKETTERDVAGLIPRGVEWIQQKVTEIDAKNKSVKLANGDVVQFDYLVVSTGLQLDWHKIEGLDQNLGKNGIHTIYEYNQVDATAKAINEFKGGTAIFVMPPVPIKCAGAPQKIMYLAEQIFKRNGVREKTKVIFTTAGKAMFGIPVFAAALLKIVKERGIEPQYQHKLVKVDAENKIAFFDVTSDAGQVTKEQIKYDLLHVVPTMSAPKLITESDLAFTEGDQKGWMAVDKFTLQSLKYPYVFGIGDVTGVPNSKTGAAIRKQYPVVVANLMAVMNGQPLSQKYDGYSSCPLITEEGKVMLAEFGYDGKLMPSFPLDPSIPRRIYWILKRYLLSRLYWYGMMKGRA